MPRKFTGGFRTLIAWKEAKALALKIYNVTKHFPKEEQYHLVSQIRDAASSVMANLAEGSAMLTKPHRTSMYCVARGSAVEVDNFLELCIELKYLSDAEYDDLTDHVARVIYLITRLIQSS